MGLSATFLALMLPLGQVGGPELSTDHPYYPGEGKMSTPLKAANAAMAVPRGTLGNVSGRDQMIRVFLWRAEHYAHLYSPAVYNLPSIQPDPTAGNQLMTDYDSMRAMFSYGWGLCGTNHAQMRVFADALGWPDRRRGLTGDTGYEIFVDGEWRYFNVDQYTIHPESDSPGAHFASIDEVVSNPHRFIEWNPDFGQGSPLPQANTHGNYQDFAGQTGLVPNRSLQWRDYYQNVWNIPAANSIKMYGEGYTATAVAVRVRRGETFTRWLHPTGIVNDLGLAGLIWWGYNNGNMSGADNGPYAEWSFVQNAPARDEVAGGAEEARGEQRWGNGCFDWQPNLSNDEHLDGAVAVTGTLSSGGSPALLSSGSSTLVLEQYTPYTVAGRPGDGVDPANSASDGAILYANVTGTVAVDISVNAGATWAPLGNISGAAAQLDFTNSVKGRNHYYIRLTFDNNEGLDSLRLRTITMLSQAVYPNLKDGSTDVEYTAGRVGALELSPDLFTAASATSTSGYVRKTADSGNVNPIYYSGETYAYKSTNNQPISVTWRIDVPPALAAAGATWKQVFAAADYQVRVPPTNTPYGQIEIAANSGGPWTQIGYHAPPADNELSHHWTYGRSSAGSSLGGTRYYVRFTTYNGGYTAGIRYLRLSATYNLPASTVPTDVTFYWNNGADQSQAHQVAAGAPTDSWTISTGSNVAQQKVVLSVSSGGGGGVPPSISAQPSNQTVTEGQTATFSVVATGSPTLTYQWKADGIDIPGANGPSYTTPATTLGDSGTSYTVLVTNGVGNTTSTAGILTVNPSGGGGPVNVTLQEGLNSYAGTTDTYLDEFSPGTDYGNQTYFEIRYFDPGGGLTEHMQSLLHFDLSSIPAGATVTAATLTVYNVRAAANGAGDVITLSRVTSAWTESHTWNLGIPTSVASGVTPPGVSGYTIAPSPPEAYVITGLEALVQGWVDVSATNYGMLLATATNLNFRLASSEYGTAQYRPALALTYTTGGGTAPTITTQPSGQIVTEGQTATFTVVATGTGPLSYQWKASGVDIPGATNASYTTPVTILADSGTAYTVVITNAFGNVTSIPAVLTVNAGGGGGGGGSGGGGGGSCGATGWEFLLMVLAIGLWRRRKSRLPGARPTPGTSR